VTHPPKPTPKEMGYPSSFGWSHDRRTGLHDEPRGHEEGPAKLRSRLGASHTGPKEDEK